MQVGGGGHKMGNNKFTLMSETVRDTQNPIKFVLLKCDPLVGWFVHSFKRRQQSISLVRIAANGNFC